MYYHDYNNLLTNILIDYTFDFNTTHEDGIDLKAMFPILKKVNHVLKASTLTPFEENEFLYGGFSFITDF